MVREWTLGARKAQLHEEVMKEELQVVEKQRVMGLTVAMVQGQSNSEEKMEMEMVQEMELEMVEFLDAVQVVTMKEREVVQLDFPGEAVMVIWELEELEELATVVVVDFQQMEMVALGVTE